MSVPFESHYYDLLPLRRYAPQREQTERVGLEPTAPV